MTTPQHSSESLVLYERKGSIALLTLNRTNALNALNHELMTDLADAIDRAESDKAIRCVVLTGQGRAFAAGADIKEMKEYNFNEVYSHNFITSIWERITELRMPIIAAVNGLALGGGCELAMMCDFIIASEDAKFGQPEITIGALPGAGGSQRMTRLIGKSKTMDLILTGRMMDATEAERSGLVARIVPADKLMNEAMNAAETIASMSKISVMLCKEAVNASQEMSLTQGIKFERRLFHSVFATDDQKEGMSAFIEKRKPIFSDS